MPYQTVMRTLAVQDVHVATFATHSRQEGDVVVVCLVGNADVAAQESLKKFLDALHAEAQALKIRELRFAVEELYFMNSSCLSLLLRHINAVLQAPAARKYKMKFKSNPNLRWQKRSLKALQSYAPDLVAIE
jgi:anti-anti-sigma factor